MTRKCASCDAEAMPGETMCYTCEWALTIRTNSLVREAVASVRLDKMRKVDQLCTCGHPLENHAENGCLSHVTNTPLVYCECTVTGVTACGHPVGAQRDMDGHMICLMCLQGEA